MIRTHSHHSRAASSLTEGLMEEVKEVAESLVDELSRMSPRSVCIIGIEKKADEGDKSHGGGCNSKSIGCRSNIPLIIVGIAKSF